MKDLKGKVAIVTGAASGIGYGIALNLARAGVNVAVADIRRDKLNEAVTAIESAGVQALAIEIDTSSPESVQAAGKAVMEKFGKLHMAFNNAGVAMHGVPMLELPQADWDWVIGVNVRGVINGMQTFVPLIRETGEGGHLVNTASIGGFQIHPDWHTGPYSMTKYAVVALTEALEQDLEGSGIGVSVLCPAAVQTNLDQSGGARPARFGGAVVRPQNHFLRELVKDGLTPEEAGERVLHAIRNDEFFIFTASAPREWIEKRHQRLMQSFDNAARWEQSRQSAPGTL